MEETNGNHESFSPSHVAEEKMEPKASKDVIILPSDDDSDDEERSFEDYVYTRCADILTRWGVGDTSKEKQVDEEDSENTALMMESLTMKCEEMRELIKQFGQEESEESECVFITRQSVIEKLKKNPKLIEIARHEVYGDFPVPVSEPKAVPVLEPKGIKLGIGRGRGIKKFEKHFDAGRKERALMNGFIKGEGPPRNGVCRSMVNGEQH